MNEFSKNVILSVKNLSKKYFFSSSLPTANNPNSSNFFWALNDVTFSLNKGDRLGIVGANGSGKTTLLKILSQITPPTSGSITIHGNLISIIDIGSSFHPDLTGRENIFIYATVMLGMSKTMVYTQLNDIIEFSELGLFIDEPLKNYSNGMYLRLALSVALFCKIDVLILDEVFSVGDNAFMQKSYNKISQIINESTTVVLASHNTNDILRFCNKCIWIDKGVVKMFAETHDVVSAYIDSTEPKLDTKIDLDNLGVCYKLAWHHQDAPKANEFTLMNVCICNEPNKFTNGTLDYNLPLIVNIEYEKSCPNSEVSFVVIVTDQFNTALLITSNVFHANNVKNLGGETGVFRHTCTLPKQLLNIGVYKINLQIILNNNPFMLLQGVLTFVVSSDDANQYLMLKRHPIKFVPTLPWEIIKV